MKIFFADPQSENLILKKKITKLINNIIGQKSYILGKQNDLFEEKLKKYFNIKYALGVNSGTDALKIALKSLKIKKNDEVIIPTLTATATGSAVLEVGAKPVLIDVDGSGNFNPNLLKSLINKKTKAIIVVHLHGNIANIKKIKSISKKIPIIEDCAQSFGSSLNRKKSGTFGKISCFSFYPTKNLAAIGDGGAIITNDKKVYDTMISLRQYGWNKNRISMFAGYNSRLDEIQASILNLKMNYIDKNNLKRNKLAKNYIKELKNLPIQFPISLKQSFHSYHLFVIMTEKRDELMKYLNKKKIFPSIHYKVPLHMMPTFKNSKKTKMNISEKMSKTMLSLPIYPELKKKQQLKIIKEIKNFFMN